ncbi:tRNA pseudouridine(38/39) synthase [Copidosoma floridanum]|uniref:tRNA pseudouridine(38/39) synthase n=1 Tax=Copidosoma floridanum TaxID=29053 RepID=UPI000C6FB44A|nr:tRNA pseudouridine(38/39) synthase [Copidosoma floridanum]
MIKVVKKNKVLSREELEALEKNDLISRILQLEAYNFQLKQIMEKNANVKDVQKSHSSKRKFDFSKCHKRHILLKLYYLGWEYQGFATQENTTSTIEHHLFNALIQSCLIQSRETSNYHRCGRTDKGVSAYSQVISLDIRSSQTPNEQNDLDNFKKEIKYCKILNRLLPKNIRCLSWSPAAPDVSARFDCKWRCYKYFFPRGNMNISAMNAALKYMIGSHDFRNLCKMDVANGVTSYIRNILEAEITCATKEESNDIMGYDMCTLTIKSNAFLWHQIRCIVGILFLVGREQETPEIVQDLLDIEKCPCKPQYSLAHYTPLNLFYCEYDNTHWYTDITELEKVIKDLQEEWTNASVKCAMTRCMLNDLGTLFAKEISDVNFQPDSLLQGSEAKVYKPLMQRDTCESLENRIEHYTKKRRLEKTSQ